MSQALSATTARIAQALWVVLALAGTVKVVESIPSRWKTFGTICHPASTCSSNQLDASAARTLSHYGISVNAFATYHIVIFAVIFALLYGLAALIIWRKPKDRGAILAAFFLAAFPLLISVSPLLIFAALTLFGLLFPDGRFAPRWTRWLALAVVIACIFSVFSVWPVAVASLVLIFPVPFLQVYRFRSLSSWTHRQQTKWAAFGLAAALFGLVALLLPLFFAPWQTANGSLYNSFFTSSVAVPIVISVIPISLAVSVLRSKLWDIDRLISRALVYASLTATLVGIYIGGVIGLQALFRIVIGNGSAPAIAISTLAIVALFGPLRKRIQTAIDRRFYRNKYDATRTVARFGERLRDEVDLGQLSRDLTAVVHDALHPAHVSLWLRGGDLSPPATPTFPQRHALWDTA